MGPVAARLAELSCDSVVLVPCGLLGLPPITGGDLAGGCWRRSR